jgi:hypothetical protein
MRAAQTAKGAQVRDQARSVRAGDVALTSKDRGVESEVPMTGGANPDELRQFLLDHVEDLAELEVLAWFHRESPGAWLSEADLLQAMPFPPDTTSAALERLLSRELVSRSVEKPGMLRFEARDTAFREMLRRALEEYRQNPVQFMALMTAISIERVRTAALTTFAECFRLGGPKSGG